MRLLLENTKTFSFWENITIGKVACLLVYNKLNTCSVLGVYICVYQVFASEGLDCIKILRFYDSVAQAREAFSTR